MKRLLLVTSVLLVSVGLASGQARVKYRYSTDLGSDLDRSDPNDVAPPVNSFMDCGDVYVENVPTNLKDDSRTVFPGDGDADGNGIFVGFPFLLATQPPPALVGASTPADYYRYFDLDAADQIGIRIQEPTSLQLVTTPNICGLYLNPNVIDFSYDDDKPAGWAVSADVPTRVAPTHGDAVRKDEVMIDTGPFGVWSPATVTGVRDEVALGLGPNPPSPSANPELTDDDVDALDRDTCRYYYWSPDHEASMNLDPGSIYLTDLQTPGVMAVWAIDDVWNIGVPESTDVDAWEFCMVDPATYQKLFVPVGGPPPVPVVIGLFSVDQDDPDTPLVDESGALAPNTVYATNLLGQWVPLAQYAEDIDALSVPEPGALALLALGAAAVLRRRRR